MSTLSLHESDATAVAANQLCEWITQDATHLRTASLGRRFAIGPAQFRLFGTGRNTIYRVIHEGEWFLKMPRQVTSSAIELEGLGTKAIGESLADSPYYTHPECCRTSVESGYILTSKISGHQLNHALYRSLLGRWLGRNVDIAPTFFALGAVLGRLHRLPAEGAPPSTRPLVSALRNHVRKAPHRDQLCQTLERYADETPELAATGFSHGNLGLNNVIANSHKVSLIDFECCGRGSIYEDLSLLCGTLLLQRLAPHLSEKTLNSSLRAFLDGYLTEHDFDVGLLARCLALRIGQNYVYWFCNDRRTLRIAGWRIRAAKVRSLLCRLLEGEPIRALSPQAEY